MRTLARLLVVTLFLAGQACTSRIVVTKVSGAKNQVKPDGVFYTLPKTEIAVSIPVKKSTRKPGPYAIWSPVFFPGEAPAVSGPASSFSLETPTVATQGIPDLDEVYMISVRSRYFETKSFTTTLDERGVATKLAAESTNDAAAFIAGSIKSAASIVAPFLRAGIPKTPEILEAIRTLTPLDPRIPLPCRLSEADWRLRFHTLTPEQADGLWEIFDIVGGGSSVKNKELIHDKLCEATVEDEGPTFPKTAAFVRSYLEASDAHAQLADLSKARQKILDTLPDRPSLAGVEEALARLDREIQKRIDRFFGTSEDQTKSVQSFWAPDPVPGQSGLGKVPTGTVTLLKLVSKGSGAGVCVIVGSKITISIPDGFRAPASSCTTPDVTLTAKLSAHQQNLVDTIAPKVQEASGRRGFRYRVPRPVQIEIEKVASPPVTVLDEDLQIAQLGEVFSLPASSGGRTTKYELDLYPSSGALKNFVMGSDPVLVKSLLDDVEAAGSTVIETQDDLAQLERRRKLLEEQRKIREEMEKLEDLNSPIQPKSSGAFPPPL